MSLLKEKLLRLLFPAGMLDYFDILEVIELPSGGIEISLEEYSSVPDDIEDRENYICHGFYDWQLIHDFPLRGDIFNLRIHRRRWIHKTSKQVVSRVGAENN